MDSTWSPCASYGPPPPFAEGPRRGYRRPGPVLDTVELVLFGYGDLCDDPRMANHSSQGTTQPGFTNRNVQRVIRATGLAGADRLQTAYVLECGQCQHRYAAKESDIFERRCPKCQSGQPSLHIDANELRKD
jgi:hypothetical protein